MHDKYKFVKLTQEDTRSNLADPKTPQSMGSKLRNIISIMPKLSDTWWLVESP